MGGGRKFIWEVGHGRRARGVPGGLGKGGRPADPRRSLPHPLESPKGTHFSPPPYDPNKDEIILCMLGVRVLRVKQAKLFGRLALTQGRTKPLYT